MTDVVYSHHKSIHAIILLSCMQLRLNFFNVLYSSNTIPYISIMFVYYSSKPHHQDMRGRKNHHFHLLWWSSLTPTITTTDILCSLHTRDTVLCTTHRRHCYYLLVNRKAQREKIEKLLPVTRNGTVHLPRHVPLHTTVELHGHATKYRYSILQSPKD